MNSNKSISTDRSFKTLRIKKKINEADLKLDSEKDYLLETGGNISEYLNPDTPFKLGPRFDNGKIVPHSIIGPSYLFVAKPIDSMIKTPVRMLTITNTSKLPNRQSLMNNRTDYQHRFNEVMKRINMARERAIFEEKERLQKLTAREKAMEQKQLIPSAGIENEKIQLNTADRISKGSRKSTSEVNLPSLPLNTQKKIKKKTRFESTDNLF